MRVSVVFGYLLLCFIWGTSWVAIKFSLTGFPPLLGAALRFAAASLILFGYARWRGIPVAPSRVLWRPLLISSVLVYVLDYGLIYWAEQYLAAGVTAIFFSTFPLFTALFANFLFRSEPFRPRVQVGLGLGFLGVLVIFERELLQTRFEPILAAASLGVLTAAAAGSVSSLIVKKRLSAVDPVALSLQQMVFGAVALLAIGLAVGESRALHATPKALLAVLYLGLAASALAFVLYYWLLQKLSAITLSLLVFVLPVVAVLFDWLLLGQKLAPQTAVGMLIILGGVGLSLRPGARSGLRSSSSNEPAAAQPKTRPGLGAPVAQVEEDVCWDNQGVR